MKLLLLSISISFILSLDYSYTNYVALAYLKIEDAKVGFVGFQKRVYNKFSIGLGWAYHSLDGWNTTMHTNQFLSSINYDLWRAKHVTPSLWLGGRYLTRDKISSFDDRRLHYFGPMAGFAVNFKLKQNIGLGINIATAQECQIISTLDSTEFENCYYAVYPGFSFNIYDLFK